MATHLLMVSLPFFGFFFFLPSILSESSLPSKAAPLLIFEDRFHHLGKSRIVARSPRIDWTR